MKDPLKELISKNRDTFDHRVPSDKIWDEIDASLPKAKQRSLWNSVVLWRVAAILFLSVSVYLFAPRPVSVSAKRSEVAKLQRDFTDQELFYNDQIAEKVAFIDDFENSDEHDQFTQDFMK